MRDRGWLGQGGLAWVLGMGGAVVLGLPEPTLAQLNLVPDTEPGLSLDTRVTNGFVEGGRSSGANLFHSFAEFNVPENQTVTFNSRNFDNSGNFENILSRVTGNDPSDILGTLGVNGPANLFLLNPNGITFGPNAQLALEGGSFVATTANAIGFPTGGEFSTTSTVVPGDALLTVNPSALFFNETPAGAIVNQSTTGLEVQPGENLLLVGGEVRVENDDPNTSTNGGILRAPGGGIALGGLAEPGVVEIVDGTDDASNPGLNFPNIGLNFPDGVKRADVSITNGSIVDVVAGDGGDIAIYANNINISGENTFVCAGIGTTASSCDTPGSAFGSPSSEAGNILFDATGEVNISQSRVENDLNPGATGNSVRDIFEAVDLLIDTGDTSVIFGSIFITAESLSVTDGASVSTSTFGAGNAGLVFIEARDSVSIEGFREVSIPGSPEPEISRSKLASTVASGAQGNAGGILIQTGSFSLTNYSLIDSSTSGQGDAGAVIVEADGAVSLANDSVIFNNVEPGGIGAGGFIDITAESLSLSNGAQMQTLVREDDDVSGAGQGNAGRVEINVRDTVTISGLGSPRFGNQGVPLPSAIFSTVNTGASGNAGNIEISARSISLSDRGQVNTNLGGSGVPGTIFLEATDSISLNNEASIRTVIEEGAIATIETNPFSNEISGSLADEAGNTTTGAILISTDTLSLRNDSEINANTRGLGDAGAVIILADDAVSLDNRSNITSRVEEVDGQGDAGGILMGVGSLSVAGGSQISTSAFGQGNPGLILVGADDEISIEGTDNLVDGSLRPSGIFSQVGENNANPDVIGGGMILTAEAFSITDGAVISVSNLGEGTAGDLIITAHEDIILNNRGAIAAVSESGKGGNIILTSGDFLLLLDGSTITTDAFNPVNPSVNAGNIFVLTRYVIAAPFRTNDIVANAVEGFGGNVFVFAARLYDIEERVEVFPTNDIDASSDFGIDGTVTENVLNVDPTQGLTNLPANPVDPSTLIAETCAPRGGLAEGERNQFIVTGRGGLPPDPNAAFPGEAVVDDVGLPEEESPVDDSSSANPASGEMASSQVPDRIEAQGWVYGEDGKIIFTAQAHTATPSTPALTPASICNDVSTSHQPR